MRPFRPWLLLALAAAGFLAWLVHRQPTVLPTAPPRPTAEELARADDRQIVSVTADLVRWQLAVTPAEQLGRWRTMGEAAQTVLAITAIEGDGSDPATPIPFQGFQQLLADPSPIAPTLDDLATAYTAIGALQTAATVRRAHEIAGGTAADRWNTCDRDFRAALGRDASMQRLRTYVRQHLNELAAVQPPR